MKSRKLGILLSYINTGLNMVCGLFLSSYLLRMLGAEDYGIYQTVASFANYLVMLQFGTGTVMTRNISMCRAKNAPQKEIEQNVNAIWSIACMLSILIAAIGIVFYVSIDRIYVRTLDAAQLRYAKTIFLYVLVHLISSFVLQTMSGAVLAYENYGFSALLGITRTLLRTLVLAALVYRYRYARVIAEIDALISMVQLFFVALYVRKRLKIRMKLVKPDREIMQVTMPLCIALFMQTLINQANNNVDKFLIGILLSPESVSVYSVAMYVYSIFSSMTTIPISMYAPMIAKEVQLGTDMRFMEKSLIGPCRMIAIIGGAIYFGFIAAGRQFVSVVYGTEYLIAWPIALLIMTPMYINMINGVLVNVLDALNRRMARSIVLMITTLANIILTIFWLQSWGIIGAALATALCTMVGQVVVMNLYYAKKLHIDVVGMYKNGLHGVLQWLVLSCLAAFGIGLVINNNMLSLIISVIVFISVFLSGYMWRGITDEEQDMVKRICRRR